MGDLKPYAVVEFEYAYRLGDVKEARLFDTVLALAQVTKERNEARAEVERLREALGEVLPFANAVHFTAETMRQGLEAAEKARAALAGKDGGE